MKKDIFKYICDACGKEKEIPKHGFVEDWLTVSMMVLPSSQDKMFQIGISNTHTEFHFCDTCTPDFIKHTQNFIGFGK